MNFEEFRESVRDFVDLHASKYEEAFEEPLNRKLATSYAIQYLGSFSNQEEVDVVSEYYESRTLDDREERVGKEVALRLTNEKDEFIEYISKAEFSYVTGSALNNKSAKILTKMYENILSLEQEKQEGLYLWYLDGFPHEELGSLERNYTRAVKFSENHRETFNIESHGHAKSGIEFYSRLIDVFDVGSPLLYAISRSEDEVLDETMDFVSLNFGYIYNKIQNSRYSSVISLIDRDIRNGVKHGDTRVLPNQESIRIDKNVNISYSSFSKKIARAYIGCEVVYGLPAIIGLAGQNQTDIDASVDF
ncbi:hypothetical protein [Halorussus aquaticus]|uniref:Apea-like HEPN domain-containing protein n=1 Tax=Halorussus aquaticus TaxID=2953748 RepID=A0ABD5Q6G9_9EURY|nr:hypothetical protein [Halorussus aquaticus]